MSTQQDTSNTEATAGESSASAEGLDWCPTRSGVYTAYYPQWLDGDEWVDIQTSRQPGGVPQPLCCGGINMELGLCGKDQALALAYAFAAAASAEGKAVEVRAAEYVVRYDLKARQKQSNAALCGPRGAGSDGADT